ncbi:MAG TPA: DUF1629 domain-containing protein, partial [Erythrobacter sp.]|nr:DUF1629 domain-containing protein [Erythrobacter sp.]
FRECIEELEPDVHEYREVEVSRKDGSSFDKRYYAINVRQMLGNVIDWERTTAVSEESAGVLLLRSPKTQLRDRVVAVKKSVVDGHHLWIPKETYGGTCWGVSEALHKLLVKRKLLKGLHSFQASEV